MMFYILIYKFFIWHISLVLMYFYYGFYCFYVNQILCFESLYKSNINTFFSYIEVIKNMLCYDLNIIYYWMLSMVCILNIFKHFNHNRLLSYEYFFQTLNQSFDDRFSCTLLRCLSNARLWYLMDAIPGH